MPRNETVAPGWRVRVSTLDWLLRHRLLVLLLTTDLIFILLHVAWLTTGLLNSRVYSISLDRSHAEFFQYMKELWILALFGLLFLKRRQIIHVAWTVLFLYILLDDALRLHENAGERISQLIGFSSRWGLRSVDFGELIFYGVVGGFFLTLLSLGYLSSDFAEKQASRPLLLLLGGLALFATVIDILDIIATSFSENLSQALIILEEGGEMAVMSLIVGWVMERAGREVSDSRI